MMNDAIQKARTRMMADRKIICTGNPYRNGTLAHGFKKLFPNAVFLCRSTGWNLDNMNPVDLDRLRSVFQGCNTFLNCSYIKPGIQETLLDLCHDTLKFCDVINIGSTHEYDGSGDPEYRDSKINLRNKSLLLDSFRFSTCHLILGKLQNNDTSKNETVLDIDQVCKTIIWIWQQPFHVPIMTIDQKKAAW